jgi:hypothetical protein
MSNDLSEPKLVQMGDNELLIKEPMRTNLLTLIPHEIMLF